MNNEELKDKMLRKKEDTYHDSSYHRYDYFCKFYDL